MPLRDVGCLRPSCKQAIARAPSHSFTAIVLDYGFSMVNCVVKICANSTRNKNKKLHGITFHKFPVDHVRRDLWLKAVKRELDWAPNSSSVVCSKHFPNSSFRKTKKGLFVLDNNATPSILLQSDEQLHTVTPQLNVPSNKPKETSILRTFLKLQDTPRELNLKSEIYTLKKKLLIARKKNISLKNINSRLRRKCISQNVILNNLLENRNLQKYRYGHII